MTWSIIANFFPVNGFNSIFAKTEQLSIDRHLARQEGQKSRTHWWNQTLAVRSDFFSSEQFNYVAGVPWSNQRYFPHQRVATAVVCSALCQTDNTNTFPYKVICRLWRHSRGQDSGGGRPTKMECWWLVEPGLSRTECAESVEIFPNKEMWQLQSWPAWAVAERGQLGRFLWVRAERGRDRESQSVLVLPAPVSVHVRLYKIRTVNTWTILQSSQSDRNSCVR